MTVSGSRRRSLSGWALRFALLLTLTGCDSCREVRIFLIAAKQVYGAKPATSDRYVGIRSTGPNGGLTFRPNRELRKPFRLEARLGFFDAAHANLGNGSFGISLLEAGGVGRFFILEVKRSGEGIVLEAGTGGPPIQTMTLADSLVADVVVQSVGGLIEFQGRKPGEATYTPIAVAVAPSVGPYVMSLDASGIPKGTIVGYDRMRLPLNAAPAAPTAAQTARETIYTAVDALAECMYALDGSQPDRAAAGTQIDLALARMDAALALDLSAFGKAKKRVTTARKRAQGLVAKVRGTAAALPLIKSLVKVITLTGQGVGTVN